MQLNKLIEFRQQLYDHGLTKARDAQFELIDVLLSNHRIASFPELILAALWQSSFFGGLRQADCAVLVRLRRDRMLYGTPAPYRGRGRPPIHGEHFAFKEPDTWRDPVVSVELETDDWGQVRLRRWDDLHVTAGQS